MTGQENKSRQKQREDKNKNNIIIRRTKGEAQFIIIYQNQDKTRIWIQDVLILLLINYKIEKPEKE